MSDLVFKFSNLNILLEGWRFQKNMGKIKPFIKNYVTLDPIM